MIRLLLLCLLTAGLVLAAEPLPLGDRLESMDRAVAMQALFDLARRGPPGSMREIEVVRTRLSDSDPNIRMAAACAVASLHDDGAVPLLITALREFGDKGSPAFRAALSTIAGGDQGGDSAEAWTTWHDGVIASTQAGCSTVRLAVQDGKVDQARLALHPLLMQRAGRDLIVDLLEVLGNGDNPRLVALAREGLMAIDTAAARLALAAIDRSLPGGATSAAAVAAAVADQVGAPGAGGAKSASGRPGEANPASSFNTASVIILLVGFAAMAWGGWFAGRRWLAIKMKVREATGSFIRSATSTFSRKGGK